MKIFDSMDDNQYWMTLWSFVIVGIFLIILALVINNSYEDKVLHDLIQAGHDPLEIACVYTPGTSSNTCLLLAEKKARANDNLVNTQTAE